MKAESKFDKFTRYDMIGFAELLNNLPENLPLYKDSGLWQLRSDDMEVIILQQGVNESFVDFLTDVVNFKTKSE